MLVRHGVLSIPAAARAVKRVPTRPPRRPPSLTRRASSRYGYRDFPAVPPPPSDPKEAVMGSDKRQTKFLLQEKDIPARWYNIQADLPTPLAPPLHPGTGQPLGPADLAPLFPMELIKQEVSQERWIEIPDEVRDAYRLWRPTPLFRAQRLEKALDTPAHIYYKYEGVSPAGSHKPNTAVRPGLLQQAGGREAPHHRDRRRPVGQRAGLRLPACSGWSARSTWSRSSYQQKPYRRILMETWGAQVVPSPSDRTPRPATRCWSRTPTRRAASASPSARPSRTRPRARTPSTRWAACSTTSCCTRRSSARRPRSSWKWRTTRPDVIIGCVGGGTNFAGLRLPLRRRQARRQEEDSASSPSSRRPAPA